MALPVKELPREVKRQLSVYRKCFTKPQYKNFADFVCGLVVSDNKTVQEIADCFGRVDQSSLNRFLTESDWSPQEVNAARILQVKKEAKPKAGVLVCDPTMLHKTGKCMEKANYHYSGMMKDTAWGHFLVNSFFTDGRVGFPVSADFYLREEDADKQHPFKTVRKIGLDQLDYALKKLPVWLFIADAGLYADFVVQELKARRLKYILGVSTSLKVSINRGKRIAVEEYLETLSKSDFLECNINDEKYFVHTITASVRGIGKQLLIVSYKEGNEEDVRVHVSNLFGRRRKTLLKLLLKRWVIECWHRDAKQHLGLEDYQVRKYRGIQKVVLAVLVAYTLVILSKTHALLKPLGRVLKTVGEVCRFFRLVALKGMRWLECKASELDVLMEILNQQVFVKNAKV